MTKREILNRYLEPDEVVIWSGEPEGRIRPPRPWQGPFYGNQLPLTIGLISMLLGIIYLVIWHELFKALAWYMIGAFFLLGWFIQRTALTMHLQKMYFAVTNHRAISILDSTRGLVKSEYLAKIKGVTKVDCSGDVGSLVIGYYDGFAHSDVKFITTGGKFFLSTLHDNVYFVNIKKVHTVYELIRMLREKAE